jgi:hypothetical protein
MLSFVTEYTREDPFISVDGMFKMKCSVHNKSETNFVRTRIFCSSYIFHAPREFMQILKDFTMRRFN